MTANDPNADVATRTTSLTVLRLVALAGSVLALGAVILAFSVNLVLGVVVLLTAPAIPLTLVVTVDRLFGR